MHCCDKQNLKRIYSRRAGRYFHKCENCGRAYADVAGQPADLPLRGDPDPIVLCPQCTAAMVRVHGAANGDFWSCSRHPRCKGTRDINPPSPSTNINKEES